MKKYSISKVAAGILGIALFVVISFCLKVPTGLAVQAEALGYSGRTAMTVLGGLAWAICWWVGMVIPEWCTALGLLCVWNVAAGVEFPVVFSSFGKSTWWLMIGAFTLTAAITKTGLMRRISLNLMRLFPPSFRGQVIAMISVGAVCSPLMPSTTAKIVLGGNLAAGSADLLGYEKNSAGRNGLFIACWTGFCLLAPTFMSASILSYSLISALPAEYANISWMQWFISMLPWGIIVLLGMYAVMMLFYRPESQGNTFSKEDIKQQCDALGKASKQEKITAVLLAVCLMFWILEKKTGISSGTVALIGGLCCVAFGVLETKEISSRIPWGFMLLVGAVLNMGDVFAATGISKWLLTLIEPILSYINNPFLIVTIVFVIAVAMRLLIASQAAVITLLTSVFAPVLISLDIHPAVAGFAIYAAALCWVMVYQNTTCLAGLEAMGGTVSHKKTVPAGIAYLVIALVGCLISVLYWKLLGYL